MLGFSSGRDYDDLTNAGYRGQQTPRHAIWGARYAIIEDPDSVAAA